MAILEGILELIAGAGIIIGLIALYFLPTIIVLNRNHHNQAPIMIINLLAGWTLLGWFIALIWSTTHVIKRNEA